MQVVGLNCINSLTLRFVVSCLILPIKFLNLLVLYSFSLKYVSIWWHLFVSKNDPIQP